MTVIRPVRSPTFSSHWAAHSRLRETLQDETCFYLGLFSLTPALLVFQSWAILPTLLIAALALRKVWLLHQRGVEAVTLNVATWLMLSLNLSLSLTLPALQHLRSSGFIHRNDLLGGSHQSGDFPLVCSDLTVLWEEESVLVPEENLGNKLLLRPCPLLGCPHCISLCSRVEPLKHKRL